MKKLISLVLAAIIIFSICSCGATTGEQGTSENQKEVEYAAAEIAYTELVKAEDLSVSIMDNQQGNFKRFIILWQERRLICTKALEEMNFGKEKKIML